MQEAIVREGFAKQNPESCRQNPIHGVNGEWIFARNVRRRNSYGNFKITKTGKNRRKGNMKGRKKNGYGGMRQKRRREGMRLVVGLICVGIVYGIWRQYGMCLSDWNSGWSAIELTETQTLLPVTLERVVDGDTLEVQYREEQMRVRLIGVDTPESKHPQAVQNTKEGTLAEQFVREVVQKGQRLYLESDVSEQDRYGRYLCYVWLKVPDDKWDAADCGKQMLNGMLLQKGYACVDRVPPDVKYSDILETLEQDAKEQQAGFWAEDFWFY